jgi:hypothetical protein
MNQTVAEKKDMIYDFVLLMVAYLLFFPSTNNIFR